MAVREQLAVEWKTDLDMLIAANEGILQSYHDSNACVRNDDDGEKLRLKERHRPMVTLEFSTPRLHRRCRKGNYDLLVLLGNSRCSSESCDPIKKWRNFEDFV